MKQKKVGKGNLGRAETEGTRNGLNQKRIR